jgi:plastocyanin
MRGAKNGPTRRTLLVAATCLVMVLATATEAFAVERVRASGTSFRPRRVSVSVGERVVWRATNGSHTVTAYRGDWNIDRSIDEGERTGFTFSDAGRYRYRCTIHSSLSGGTCTGMCGLVVVG